MTKPVMITGVLLLFFSSLVKAEEPLVAPKPAEPVKEIDFRDPIPFGLPPVEYGLGEHSDPASRLDQELAARTRKLNYEPQWGYLRDVLKALQISESSQLMVFYFNDNVYVGWVPGAE